LPEISYESDNEFAADNDNWADIEFPFETETPEDILIIIEWENGADFVTPFDAPPASDNEFIRDNEKWIECEFQFDFEKSIDLSSECEIKY
jgi:hypothetical protein